MRRRTIIAFAIFASVLLATIPTAVSSQASAGLDAVASNRINAGMKATPAGSADASIPIINP